MAEPCPGLETALHRLLKGRVSSLRVEIRGDEIIIASEGRDILELAHRIEEGIDIALGPPPRPSRLVR